MSEQVSRRRVVASGFAIGAGIALSQAVSRGVSSQTPIASPAGGEWTFTDDRGITVSLPQTPTRVVAQTSSAASLWDFGFEVVGFYGPNDPDNTAGFPQVGDMDVSRIPNVGDYGAPDIEKFLSLKPQLYVDLDRGGDTLWYLDADTQATLEQVCPTIGIDADGVSVIDIVKRYEDLAVALGVDPESETIVTARETFTASETAFTEAVSAHDDLKVLTVSPAADGTVTLWNPNWLPDLIYFTSLGFTGVAVGVDDATPNVQVSMEELGEYPADVILVDVRREISAFEGNAIWESLPAVQAGQVGRWYAAFPYSYQKLAEVLDHTSETLATAEPVV
ncbi:MAG: ABC transporter substrate-binding protein [Thermomicrobiales bacterium]